MGMHQGIIGDRAHGLDIKIGNLSTIYKGCEAASGDPMGYLKCFEYVPDNHDIKQVADPVRPSNSDAKPPWPM